MVSFSSSLSDDQQHKLTPARRRKDHSSSSSDGAAWRGVVRTDVLVDGRDDAKADDAVLSMVVRVARVRWRASKPTAYSPTSSPSGTASSPAVMDSAFKMSADDSTSTDPALTVPGWLSNVLRCDRPSLVVAEAES